MGPNLGAKLFAEVLEELNIETWSSRVVNILILWIVKHMVTTVKEVIAMPMGLISKKLWKLKYM